MYAAAIYEKSLVLNLETSFSAQVKKIRMTIQSVRGKSRKSVGRKPQDTGKGNLKGTNTQRNLK